MYVFIFLFLFSCDILDMFKATDDEDADKKYELEITPPQQLVSGHEFSFKVELYRGGSDPVDVEATVSLSAECDGEAKDLDDQDLSKGIATFAATFELAEDDNELECRFIAATTINDTDVKSEEYTVMLVHKLELAVIGDSLATGIFSDVKMGILISYEKIIEEHPLLASVLLNFLQGKKFDRSALDKQLITHQENPFTCAANGNKDACKFSLQQKMGLKTHQVRNFAQSGSQTAQLLTQLDTVNSQLGYAMTYVISVGGNDFCANSFDKASYLTGMQAIVDKIKQQNNAAKILIMAIPNVVALLTTVAPSSRLTASIKEVTAGSDIDLSCGQIRDGKDVNIGTTTQKLEPFCPRLTKGIAADSGGTFVKTQSELLKATNEELADLATKDGNIKFAASIGATDFTIDDLAVDCFHPNVSGQKKIAAELFKYKF